MKFLLPVLFAISRGEDCWNGPTSRYDGTQSKTKSGLTCQDWSLDKPHVPKHRPKDVQNGASHNHCRNPDLDLSGPWCYTTANETRWEYCEIDVCKDDDSFIVFTNFNADEKSSHLVRVHANPEIVRSATDTGGSFNVQTVFMTNTKYWALAADYKNGRIYWTDYRAEKIGKHDMKQNKTDPNLFKGMAHGIENLAVDYTTGNLYWTDSDYKWIMVADQDCKHYSHVYKATDDPDGPPYGLAIDSQSKTLFWSTYKVMGATIKKADLTANGNNAAGDIETIIKFPNIHDVTGLTVDQSDSKIYWTDFLGSAAVLASANFDGSHIINHFHRTGAVFWGVAAYDHYLYISDIYPKFMTDGKKYMLWVVTKMYAANDTVVPDEQGYIPEDALVSPANEQKNFRYSIAGRPRGVAVYSKYATLPSDNTACTVDANGRQGGCEHICIPHGDSRICQCSLGFTLKKPQMTDCYPDVALPPYLITADVDHGMMFQMSLKGVDGIKKDKLNYNVIPTASGEKVHALCVDLVTQDIYYSSKSTTKIYKTHPDNTEAIHDTIHSGVVAQSCVVDLEGSNIFFVEGETRNIQVVSTNPDNQAVKTVIDFETNDRVNIQNVAIDPARRRLYWTDPTMTEGAGKIESSNLDGSDRKVVVSGLHWPQGIAIFNYGNQFRIRLKGIKVIPLKTSAGSGDDNVLLFTEALNGVIYEVDLGYLNDLPKEGKSAQDLMGDKDHVTVYNVTATNPKTQQFYMDVTLYEDYIYFTDLKETFIERFDRNKAKSEFKSGTQPTWRAEQYGMADFYSLVYMNAIGEDPISADFKDGNACHDKCTGANELCLAMLDVDKKPVGQCTCTDNAIRDENGDCIVEIAATELVIDNCPTDTHRSPPKCAESVDFNKVPLQVSLNGDPLPISDFTVEASALNVEQSSSPKTFDSSVALSPGIHSITYKVTSKNGVGKPVQCSHKVTVALHTCERLDFAENIYLGPIKDKIQTHFIGCLKADSVTHENTQASEKDAYKFGTTTTLKCVSGNFQPFVDGKPLQDVTSLTVGWPRETIDFTCGSLTSNFISADLGSLPSEYNNKKVTMQCVDKDAAVVQQEDIPEVGPDGELPTSAPKSTEASEETTKDTVVTEAPADESDVDKVVDKKSNGGVAAVVIIVLIVVAVVAFVLYKRCKSDYQGMWF